MYQAENLENPLPLAQALVGLPPTDFREAKTVWNRGVAQYSSASAYFAKAPEPTAFAGLCRIALHSVTMAYVEPRTETSGLVPGPRQVERLYALADLAPSLAPAPAAGNSCRTLGPLLQGDNWQVATVRSESGEAEPVTAAFAYRALVAARKAAALATSGCTDEFLPACRDPRGFLAALDPRNAYALTVRHCGPAARRLCVDVRAPGGTGDSGAELAITTLETNETASTVRIEAIAVSSSHYPVA